MDTEENAPDHDTPSVLRASRKTRQTGERLVAHHMERHKREEKERRRIERLLEGMSPATQAACRQFAQRRLGAGIKPGTVVGYLETLSKIDVATHGTPWNEMKADQVETWLKDRCKQVSLATVDHDKTLIRSWLRYYDDADELRRGWKRATAYGKPTRHSRRRPIPPEHFQLILEYFEDDPMMQAVCHVLHDVGFRLEELLSLNVGSVEPDDEYGMTYRLPAREQARFRLKTGPRACYAITSIGALRAWLQFHPFSEKPSAPLFVTRENQQDHAGWLPLGPDRVYVRLSACMQHMELPNYTPHWFRHTAATQKAKLGWSTTDANKYFGWTPGSTQWDRVYVHLVDADMRARVRRDQGIDERANRVRTAASKLCLFCAEEIQPEARKCKHCGEFVESSQPRPHRPTTNGRR